DPAEEIRVGYEILKALNYRQESATLVACPTCGRLEYDMVPTVKAVEAHIAKLRLPITVAVMGCVVNGPAEARHADIGVTGGRGKGVIFRKGKLYRTVPQEELLPVLLAEIDQIAGEQADKAEQADGAAGARLVQARRSSLPICVPGPHTYATTP